MEVEMTAEQLAEAENMPLDKLRELALANAHGMEPGADAEVAEEKKAQPRAADGKFVAANQSEVLDVPDAEKYRAAEEEQVEEVVEEPEDVTRIYRKEIANGNGSYDVYEADSLEELVDKIAEGKRLANQQLQKIQAERRVERTRTAQEIADDEYRVGEQLKRNPLATMKQVAAEVLIEKTNEAIRSREAEERFLISHPLYDPSLKTGNGDRMKAEFIRLYPQATEFTSEGLEKAYQSLSKSGLLKLRSEVADVVAETETEVNQRTAGAAAKVTQQRSSKKSSTISTTRSSTKAPVANQGPTEDDLYKMPLDKLRDLANSQLSKAGREE
jgi:hypothetical protein